MSSPPQELNHQYFLAPTVLALNTLASTLSRRVCEPLDDPTPKDGKNFKDLPCSVDIQEEVHQPNIFHKLHEPKRNLAKGNTSLDPQIMLCHDHWI